MGRKHLGPVDTEQDVRLRHNAARDGSSRNARPLVPPTTCRPRPRRTAIREVRATLALVRYLRLTGGSRHRSRRAHGRSKVGLAKVLGDPAVRGVPEFQRHCRERFGVFDSDGTRLDDLAERPTVFAHYALGIGLCRRFKYLPLVLRRLLDVGRRLLGGVTTPAFPCVTRRIVPDNVTETTIWPHGDAFCWTTLELGLHILHFLHDPSPVTFEVHLHFMPPLLVVHALEMCVEVSRPRFRFARIMDHFYKVGVADELHAVRARARRAQSEIHLVQLEIVSNVNVGPIARVEAR
mmetsp:Transcript_80988/g.225376  ORF Transcript_80988/g.225376 Transcript_80988/m.225376 type:complete len:293 (-) Transcript_80988:1007-1885(-)